MLDAKALGQSPWGQLCRGGALGFPCVLRGELWCLFSAAEVSLPGQVSFPPVMPWCWLWSVFLSLVARLCVRLSWSFFSFRVGKACEVMSLGRAWGVPSWSEGLGVASACEGVALGVGT